jgi:hypothetical protein
MSGSAFLALLTVSSAIIARRALGWCENVRAPVSHWAALCAGAWIESCIGL